MRDINCLAKYFYLQSFQFSLLYTAIFDKELLNIWYGRSIERIENIISNPESGNTAQW